MIRHFNKTTQSMFFQPMQELHVVFRISSCSRIEQTLLGFYVFQNKSHFWQVIGPFIMEVFLTPVQVIKRHFFALSPLSIMLSLYDKTFCSNSQIVRSAKSSFVTTILFIFEKLKRQIKPEPYKSGTSTPESESESEEDT